MTRGRGDSILGGGGSTWESGVAWGRGWSTPDSSHLPKSVSLNRTCVLTD